MGNKRQFPKTFFWGGATSGPQTEGSFDKLHDSVFDYWFKQEPEKFHQGVGPGVASDFYHQYPEDIKRLKAIGFNSFRTSIQWTRLIKDFETGEVDPKGLQFYNQMIDALLAADIKPIINLHHFDLPVELLKHGGWTSRHVVDLFVLFAQKAFECFGDRVKYWTTFNEPIVVVEGQYLYQFHYPNEVDGKKAVQALYHLNLASAKAIRAFRDMGLDAKGGEIGIILNLTPAYPKDPENPGDALAARYADAFFNQSFLDIALKGKFDDFFLDWMKRDGMMWQDEAEDAQVFEQAIVDFLGVNYYQPRRVQEKVNTETFKTWMPEKYFDYYEMPGRRMNPYRGWEIYPEAIFDIAMNLKENYGNPKWFISENGMGIENEERFLQADGEIKDDDRIDFYREHLEALHRGIAAGANCFGYHVWTPIDCWSWCNAYKNRYGFIAVDLTTQKRKIKRSGYWFKRLADTGELE